MHLCALDESSLITIRWVNFYLGLTVLVILVKSFRDKHEVGEVFEGEMLIRTPLKNLLHNFFQMILHSYLVIVKSIIDPDSQHAAYGLTLLLLVANLGSTK